jgi:hypothetical protein
MGTPAPRSDNPLHGKAECVAVRVGKALLAQKARALYKHGAGDVVSMPNRL